MNPAIPVLCVSGGASCTALAGGLKFTRLNGNLYQGSDGKLYSGGRSDGGISVMTQVIDARPPTSTPPVWTAPGAPTDQYGSAGGFHDWYLIALALLTLYAVMKVFPKWGVPLGWLVLAGAILSTEPAVNGFNRLVKSIQTGSIQ